MDSHLDRKRKQQKPGKSERLADSATQIPRHHVNKEEDDRVLNWETAVSENECTDVGSVCCGWGLETTRFIFQQPGHSRRYSSLPLPTQ